MIAETKTVLKVQITYRKDDPSGHVFFGENAGRSVLLYFEYTTPNGRLAVNYVFADSQLEGMRKGMAQLLDFVA